MNTAQIRRLLRTARAMPDDLRQIKSRLSARWSRGTFLKAEAAGEPLFPLTVSIKNPSASFIAEHFEEVRIWIQGIKSGCEKAGIAVEWKEINHRQLGRNFIPVRIVFDSIEQLAVYLGHKHDLNKHRSALSVLSDSFPELSEWGARHPFELIKYSEVLGRLISVLEWVRNNPRPAIYLRQLSLPGVDTKFIEKHRKLLSAWLDIILSPEAVETAFTGTSRFEQRYGFLTRPEQVRFRRLDNKTADTQSPAVPFSDMSVPAGEFASWEPKASRIFVVENDVTALAFPAVPDSILIFGRGYNFSALSGAGWLNEKELWYWGDIDTHGFAILSQFRSLFPKAKSFLMDRETLMRNRDHWGTEPKQAAPAALPNLTPAESALYADLKSGTIRPGLRLEQEFICFDDVDKFLAIG